MTPLIGLKKGLSTALWKIHSNY